MKNFPKAAAPHPLVANDAYTFLMKELEKVDETILEPLSGTDWPRDLPVVTGGGFIETIASIDVQYASSGGDDDNLILEASNDIPVIQADLSKQVARTFSFAEYMAFPFIGILIQCLLPEMCSEPYEIKASSQMTGCFSSAIIVLMPA